MAEETHDWDSLAELMYSTFVRECGDLGLDIDEDWDDLSGRERDAYVHAVMAVVAEVT